MNRLWLKIFVAFWAVIVTTIAVTAAVNSLVFRDAADSRRFAMTEESLDALTDEAQRTLDSGGEAALRDWLRARDSAQPFPPVFVLTPDGRDLLGRPLPPRLRDGDSMARKAMNGRRGRGPAHIESRTLRDAGGGIYRMALPRFRPRFGGLFMRPQARLMFSIVLILISGAACLLLARYLTRPIGEFRTLGQRIAGGDLAARVGPDIGGRRDEIGALARDFDRMAQRLEALLKSQQQLMRDVSHELRSPLARLQAAVGLIRQRSGDADDRNLNRVEREAENLNLMIGEILRFSRLQDQAALARERVDIAALVGDVVADANFEGQAIGREVLLKGEDSIMAEIDASLVRSAIENIVRNALQHSREKTIVNVDSIAAPADSIRIIVSDDGPGVQATDLERIFEPFFTASQTNDRAGAGIGLAIAKRAIELHGGTVEAKNGQAGGLTVEIRLPLD